MVTEEYFKYLLLDNENEYIRELDSVEKATISYSSLGRLKQKATINMCEVVDVNNRIQVIHVLDGVEKPLGTFLLSTPRQNIDDMYTQIAMECYSTLWLLDVNKLTERLYVAEGTNVVNECIRLLTGYGVEISITESSKTTSVPREWEIGISILDVVNDLLGTINYTSLYVDGTGSYMAKPYILPEDREIDFTYNEEDEDNIVLPNMGNELDFFDIPNVWVKYVNNPQTPNLTATYENNNPQSPTSTYNRQTNVHVEEVMDAPDVETLMSMCKRDLQSAMSVYHKVTINTAIEDGHSYMNTIQLNLNGIQGKFTETDWDIECTTGGNMTHSLREGVTV